jgi:hypothetical protein
MLSRWVNYAAVLVLAIPCGWAQQNRISKEGGNWVQEATGTLAAARNLRIKMEAGSVKVQGGSQQAISYVFHSRTYSSSEQQARHELESYRLTTSSHGDTATITAEWAAGRPRQYSGDLIVTVPRNMESVRVATDGGDVSATGLGGRFNAESGGGAVHLDDIAGDVQAETGGDAIEVGTVGGDVTLRTGGGSIKIGSVKGKISAESGGGDMVVTSGMQSAVLQTGGGNIRVIRCGGPLKATTGGGSIDLGEIGGEAEVETGGGSIRLTSARGPVRAETGSGSIELSGILSAMAQTGAGGIVARFVSSNGSGVRSSTLETAAGDITVYLSTDIHMNIRASIEMANGHSIRSEFSDIRVVSEGGDYGPRMVSAEGALNGGGPLLKVRTSSGNIRILRTSH